MSNPHGNMEYRGPELQVPVPEDFNFAETVGYMSRSGNECMHYIDDGTIYKRIPVGPEYPIVKISGGGEEALHVRFQGTADPPSASTHSAAVQYIREWFDLDTDLTPFYAMAHADELLRPTVDRFRGLRIVGIPDLFEALCWAIIGQQINLAFAYTLKRRFVERYGRCAEWKGRSYWLFPTPERIAGLAADDLIDLQMTAKKSEYLIGAAKLIAEGKLSKELLLNEEHGGGSAEQRLVAIRGIGPWTANYVMMRCLRIPSAFPVQDVGLHNAIKHLTGTERKPTVEEIKQMSASWTGWEAYATFYLWRVLY
ncbi:DNA-3-methyladenine glycosylase [Paenibacillus sp. MSJ-34]|uniref:DNA-3-methyladenine glycosylase family protein n=1 Tax=Paenibacillus sp. MSJ-34 TaxID=2841529 RepID=UPI0026468D5E|nr:DNA-3-methyladenine glycosylase [Paenibacillus sp. MSJ-34]